MSDRVPFLRDDGSYGKQTMTGVLQNSINSDERTQCESTWQECVSRAGLSSSTFRACAEACADANTPALCRESKPQRLQP